MYSGFLRGFMHRHESPVQYILRLDENEVQLNDWIGEQLEIRFLHEIRCIHCSRKIKKTYNSGYCYPCFIALAENDLCIVKPHECHFDQGTCRDEAFAQTHCMVPHYVYLAVSSGLKVGLTRKGNQMKRWTDQGAVQAIPIAELPTRKLAGELEFELSKHVMDKTDWRKMLKGEVSEIELLQSRDEILAHVPEAFKPYLLDDTKVFEFLYPQLEPVQKIKTYDLDKSPVITDRLIGIKGSYLMFGQAVMNVKKFSGYRVSISRGVEQAAQ
ncbi:MULTISPECIES: DUF2797 domain-containing protein [Paenibacillus]|uniref:Uncharacterized protein n=1 Tax=Paenibacillus naphthalenovorans TaxID=162209 RepID=A0A0U2VUY7_9BACL|nr:MULTISPECIES: DUF2797 domain-containing protein [Paenibacillus]ALS23351.1 hypothetical protein IJ22_29780 [Paenibacillus naphthalenovorans]GCL72831.1 DUF2797 domain-containing protein [Paenibacillus naphthalenovorans]SDI07968.1 Protein of unknown function [Paenibacillus naphthalenovorans]